MTNDEKLDALIDALKENTEITRKLYDMLDKNTQETDWLFNKMKVLLSPEQEWRNFGFNVLANAVTNAVELPAILKFNGMP